MNVKVLFKKRINWTFAVKLANFKTQEVSDWYCQFSITDPWLLPKYEPEFGEEKYPLYGWLFFYFGRHSSGMVTKIEESEVQDHKTVIRDKYGEPYLLYGLKDPELRRKFRKTVKSGRFSFSAQMQPCGEAKIIATQK